MLANCISIESHPKWQNRVTRKDISNMIRENDPKLKFYEESLSEEDYLDFLEGIISPHCYDRLEEEMQIFVDDFFGKVS